MFKKKEVSLKNYLHKLFVVVCFIAILFASRNAHASHSMGADLTYHYLGGNRYEITLSFYRDCFGIFPQDSVLLSITSSCFPDDAIYLHQDSGTGHEITPHCPSAITTCNGGTYTGIQQYIYHGIVTVAGSCSDWTFGYEQCCRNAAITTVNNPDISDMYIYATLNNTITSNNNSPTFSNLPVPFVCLGQQFCYNHGAFDMDGDSLGFSLITPYFSSGVPITYLNPFTAMNPLTSNPPVIFNPLTGDICMTPTTIEVTVMAVLVKEYRNGVLIGSVERDIQVTVFNCNNQIPALTGINGSNLFLELTCAGTQTCFNIFSSDSNANQNTTVTWNYAIPSATFTTVPGPRESASFCWTPTQADISSIPHCFTATVHDDNCPMYGSQTYSYCITVTGINVNAGPNQSVGCNAQATLTATATGGSGNYTYHWNTGQTTSTISAGPGTYWVTASDGRCTNTDTVVVNPNITVPVANFSIVNSCTSLAVQFNSLSTISGGTIASYHWHFGDGDSSNLQSPLHNYTATGVYPVTLIIQSLAGCIDSVVQWLDLSSNQPVAAFTFNNACSHQQVNFTDHSTSSSAIVSWLWSFGDASTSSIPNPAHVYSSPGTYPVTLIMRNTNGCRDSISHNVSVFPAPLANAGIDHSICRGSDDTLIASGGVIYQWNPGGIDSATIIISPTTSQYYVITVTDTNNCMAIDSVLVTVNPAPFANAGNNHSICIGSSTTLTGSGSGYYLWDPGGDTTRQVTVSPTTSTIYTLTVTNAFGCQSSDQTLVTVNPLPNANAGPDQSICSGNQVTLSATGGINFRWLPFGATTSSITFTPVATATYMLIASSGPGCRDTDYVSVTLNPLPTASFLSPLSACANALVQFTDQSSVLSGAISWSWNFGNSVTSSLQHPAVVYTSPGNYNITLVVTSDEGCTDLSTAVISIIAAPVAAFNVSNVCRFDTVRFLNNSTISTGEALNYQWNFGDVNTSVSTNPVHYYPGTGTYHSTLLVTSASGCTDTVSNDVTVYALPTANAGLDQSICSGNAATLTASGGVSYLWNPGGLNSSSINVSPVNAQTYHVQVTDAHNCQAGDDVQVTVNPNPIADAGADQTVCSGSTATLTASGGISYSWNPGGATSQQILVNPTLATTYVVTVTNSFGCEGTDQVDVAVNSLPVANAGTDQSVCSGNQVTFVATGGGSYQWQPVGDTSSSISFIPLVNATYTLTVTNANGCEDTDQVSVAVNPLPVANFSGPAQACSGSLINFSDQSAVSSGAVSAWSWYFGNALISSSQNPAMNLTDTGMYVVHLVVTTNAGCLDSVDGSVSIAPLPDVSFNANDVCLHRAVNFSNTSLIPGGEPLSYEWRFGDNSLPSSVISPSHLYVDYGNYFARLTATSLRGCIDSTSAMLTVHALPLVNFSSVSICENDPVHFNNLSTIPHDAIAAWNWYFGDSYSSGIANPDHAYTTFGNYPVQLIVTSSFGCIDSTTKTQRINPNPVPDFAGEQKCFGDSIRFINLSHIPAGSIDRWQWFFGDRTYAYTSTAVHLYHQPGYYHVQLLILSDSGCRATVVLPAAAIVYPLPEASFLPNTTNVDEIFPSVTFINQSATAATSSWDFGDGTFSSDFSPFHTYPHTGIFEVQLIVTDRNGCRDTTYSSLEVKPVSTIFVPNAFTPNGDGINEVFRAIFINIVKLNTQIFDRWGVKIAEWSDLNGSWDGNAGGKQAPSDVYVYRIDYTDITGKKDVLIGHVTLVR